MMFLENGVLGFRQGFTWLIQTVLNIFWAFALVAGAGSLAARPAMCRCSSMEDTALFAKEVFYVFYEIPFLNGYSMLCCMETNVLYSYIFFFLIQQSEIPVPSRGLGVVSHKHIPPLGVLYQWVWPTSQATFLCSWYFFLLQHFAEGFETWVQLEKLLPGHVWFFSQKNALSFAFMIWDEIWMQQT